MHRLNTIPGGWNPDANGVIFVEQNPAPIVIITAADTDIQSLAAVIPRLSPQFPAFRVVNLLQLQQQLSIDTYAEQVLSQAQGIVLRLLGGRSYWSYGLEVVKETVEYSGATLFVIPGDDRPDPDLISHSTASLNAVDRLWHYFIEGGVENYSHALQFVADLCLKKSYNPPLAKPVPKIGVYDCSLNFNKQSVAKNKVGILFYRAHYLAGNTLPIDALSQALIAKNLQPIPIYISSLREPEIQKEIYNYFRSSDGENIQVLLNTTSFSLAKIDDEEEPELWQQLNIPVLQVILSGGTKEQWSSSLAGLTPRDVAMNVALPEVDGRIITRAVSFKSIQTWNEYLETDVVIYEPSRDRINFVADLAANWISLRQTPNHQRKIALVLANYPNKDGRIANAVGLDTPASCLAILQALQEDGYYLEDVPTTGEELINRLTAGITNDPEGKEIRKINQYLSTETYRSYFQTLPEPVQQAIIDRWGSYRGEGKEESLSKIFPIPGIQLGNVFVGIQPSRGYDLDPSLNYHAPDLEPTHQYLAYYYWLRDIFTVDAIVHVGKHGNLEWLPGKSVSLSSSCYPEITLGTIPNFYPFIVNDPGEGSQAKRRSHAVIIDHLTPPMTRAELYGGLQQLETLIDEYYEAQTLDPSRLKIISDRITELVKQSNLHRDLGIEEVNSNSIDRFLSIADGYLCELKEAQIRDGLHIFGKCPQHRQLKDLLIAIARCPSFDRLGLTRAIALDFHLDFNPLTANPIDRFSAPLEGKFSQCRHIGDAIELLEDIASELVEELIQSPDRLPQAKSATSQELQWMQSLLLPVLKQSDREIINLLRGLDGQYVAPGSAGAPTRGRPDVLPTGRNFYSVDIRAVPTETAWDIGRKAAEATIERYTQEQGEYPQTLAISIWGTSTMRTGGDDIAQVLALMGVRPIWDGLSRRVVDFEILTPSLLGRPRVDVTVRVSGFFRDSFPNLLDLLYKTTKAVASLEEEKEINPLAAEVQRETEWWQLQGFNLAEAQQRASYRVFTSKPGAYGTGLQGLIESQNWQDDRDLARAYINSSSYAYGADNQIYSASEALENRLQQLQVVLHNQDNREHDLLDSDDYYQFQGGLTASVRALTGKNPTTYFGDNSLPSNPKVKLLTEEIAKVYRSRVVNPKWIEGVMRHGYKGASEMSATVDFLFAYDATARCVEDYMYQGVAEAYLLDEKVQNFIRETNPWALRDMAERLLEANQRNLWQSVTGEMLDELRNLVNHTEGMIEMRNS